MGDIRRTHTREFKIEAVRLVTEKGLSMAQAARPHSSLPLLNSVSALPGKDHIRDDEQDDKVKGGVKRKASSSKR